MTPVNDGVVEVTLVGNGATFATSPNVAAGISLNDEFYYDEQDLRSEVPSSPVPTSGITNTSVAKQTPPPVQPLPPQPKAVATAPMTKPINPTTGLTTTETALLSPTEQQIRINQRT